MLFAAAVIENIHKSIRAVNNTLRYSLCLIMSARMNYFDGALTRNAKLCETGVDVVLSEYCIHAQ